MNENVILVFIDSEIFEMIIELEDSEELNSKTEDNDLVLRFGDVKTLNVSLAYQKTFIRRVLESNRPINDQQIREPILKPI